MAKIWKPKYWDAKNPPDSGSRVFVGRANGASSYETITTGQTKRILQSNGRGNIFYGNVTVYYSPLEPALTSNLPVGDYSNQGVSAGHESNVFMRLLRVGATTVSESVNYRTTNNFNFREATLEYVNTTSSGGNIVRGEAPGSCTNALKLANKITIYLNDSTWYIVNTLGRTELTSASDVGYSISKSYVMALSGGLDPNNSVDIRTVTAAIDAAIEKSIQDEQAPKVRIILSNEPSWSN